MAEANPSGSFAIPQPRRAIVGVCLTTGFLGFFVALGVHNLLNGIALIPSSLWLLLVGLVLFGFCKERGIKQVLTEILGAFARKQFAWIFRNDADRVAIRFGFEIFGSRHFYHTIPATRVASVNWSTGQASHFAGRDMDDWSVVLWYEHGDPAKTQAHKSYRRPDQEVYIVGLTAPKQETAAFGHEFLEFLREAGVELVPGENDCTFVCKLPAGEAGL